MASAQHARTSVKAKKNSVAKKKRERLQVSGSDTEGSIKKGLGLARRVKIELSEAEKKLKELHLKRDADIESSHLVEVDRVGDDSSEDR